MTEEPEEPLLPAPCCACGQDVALLRNIVMLPFRRPDGKTLCGWGCAICELPSVGAVACVCDPCQEAGAELVAYVAGDPKECLRRPVSELTEPFDHDQAAHDAYEQNHFEGPWYE